MQKRGIEIPKIWMKGQIWCWSDPVYGSKANTIRKPIPMGEMGLRYSRMVLIFCADHLIPQKAGEVIVIPLSGHQQWSTDLQINLSAVLRNDSQTYVCVSCIHMVRTADLTQYVCSISDEQMNLVNHALMRTLMNPEAIIHAQEPMVRQAAIVWDEEAAKLIQQFMEMQVVPNTRLNTVGCYGINVWGYWRKWCRNNQLDPDMVPIQDFGNIFVRIYGDPEYINMLQDVPFSQIPFKFKVINPIPPVMKQEPETIDDLPEPEKADEPSVTPETMVTDAIKEAGIDVRQKSGQEAELVATVPRETISIGPDNIIVDKDDWNTIIARKVRAYYVIRDKRVVGIMTQMKVEPEDRILCYSPEGQNRMIFNCEADIKNMCQYCQNHTMTEAGDRFGMNNSAVSRIYGAAATWAGCAPRDHVPYPKRTAVKKPEVPTVKMAKPAETKAITLPTSEKIMGNIDTKVNYIAHLISSFMEADDTYSLAQRYELNHLVNIPEALFYRKIRTSAYFALGEMLELKRDGNVWVPDDRKIEKTSKYLKSYLFLETTHTNPIFASKAQAKVKVGKMRTTFGPQFGLDREYAERFRNKMMTHMNLTEEGADTITSIISEYFCEQDTAPVALA